MARAIVVTSGKGGVGKTTITANLGRMLGILGRRVLLIDTDMGLNNLDVALNIEKKVVFDIVDVLAGRCRLKQAIVEDVVPGVYVLPSAHTYDDSNISAAALRGLIDTLAGFDFCLLDCPAGIEVGFHRAVTAADEALVVTTPHVSALKDADKVVAILKTYKIKPLLVLNRVRGDLVLSADMVAPADVKGLISAPLAGVVPDDDAVGIYGNTGKALPKSNDGYKATMILAKNILYGSEIIYDATKKYRGFFGRLKRAAKRSG
ncbi:MAG: septum site-determining protein MinD [Firmicutes bacterium]|nr:septum site-determining protein MinD [Bacillota bacterium]